MLRTTFFYCCYCLSNTYIYILGFVFGQTKQLRKAFYNSEKGSITSLENKTIISTAEGLVHHLRLSSDEKTIIVGLSNKTILTYQVSDILEKVKKKEKK